MNDVAADILASSVATLFAIVGVALTLLTLPGTWLAILVATGLQAWRGDLYSWWTLIICAVIALVGEAVEIAASALGAAKGGASRKGALAAVVGSLVGAVVGSFFLPPIGTIMGAVLGAGGAALWVEHSLLQRPFAEAAKAGTGAAAGRLIATLAKAGLSAVVAGILIGGAWLG